MSHWILTTGRADPPRLFNSKKAAVNTARKLVKKRVKRATDRLRVHCYADHAENADGLVWWRIRRPEGGEVKDAEPIFVWPASAEGSAVDALSELTDDATD